jgi:hypothetical protein
MPQVLVHISATDGHHPSYQALFVRTLDGKPSTGKIFSPCFLSLLFAERLFFCTIDNDLIGFLSVSLLRVFFNRPTVGLFIRPLVCFSSKKPFLYRFMRLFFQILRSIPLLRILSIIPYELEPRLALITHDWIYDPQLWDLWVDGQPSLPDTSLSRIIQSKRLGRDVIAYIGRANDIKGFPEFVNLATLNYQKFLFVFAGQIPSQYLSLSVYLRSLGMVVEGRYVSESEVLSIYKVSDYAWCRYSPAYDQASGVFGRAVQTGVQPLLREGSLIEKIYRIIKSTPPLSLYERDIAVIRSLLT